jgi:hypothetical protein
LSPPPDSPGPPRSPFGTVPGTVLGDGDGPPEGFNGFEAPEGPEECPEVVGELGGGVEPGRVVVETEAEDLVVLL